MQKKLLSVLLTGILSLSAISTVFAAEEVHPKVFVDDRLIYFEDQEPVISENNDTLIPVRGVLEAMGAQVTWNGEDRSVYVKAKDNIVRLLVKLDNPIMTKYTLTSVTTVDTEELTLSTAPRLMNERTMIPLRVISENLGALVDWDGDDKIITIKTKEYQKYIAKNSETTETGEVSEYNPKNILPYLYIETDKTVCAPEEEITVSVKVANVDKITDYNNFAGLTAGIFYDDEILDCTAQTAIINGEPTTAVLGAANTEFLKDSVKYVYIVMPSPDTKNPLADGTVAQFTFVPKTDDETVISLSNRITHLGSDTSFLVEDDNFKSISLEDSNEIYIDTTPILINAK